MNFNIFSHRLFFNLNEKYSLQLEQMNNKIDFLKSDYEKKLNEIEKKNDNLEKKNEDLESKLGQFQDDQKDKLDELNNNITDNRIRVEHLEGEKSFSRRSFLMI